MEPGLASQLSHTVTAIPVRVIGGLELSMHQTQAVLQALDVGHYSLGRGLGGALATWHCSIIHRLNF
jgi:hypothetical protein